MKVFSLLMTLFVFSCYGDNRYLIFPSMILQNSDIKSLTNLTCGRGLQEKVDGYTSFDIWVPMYAPDKKGGHFCRKYNHEVVCDTGLNGWDFKINIKPTPISEEECQSMLNEQISGKLKTVALSYPKCRVNDIVRFPNVRIDLEYQFINFNRLRMGLIHPFFHDGICRTPRCASVHPNIYWIGEEPTLSCTNLRPGSAFFYPDEYNNTDYALIDPDFSAPIPLSTGCKGVSYCGLEGLQLESGALILPRGENSEQFLKEISKDLKVCTEVKIKEVTAFEATLATNLQDLYLYHQIQCESVLENIKSNSQIKESDLIYLSPLMPGNGVGIRLVNNTFEFKILKFERVYNFKIDCPDITNCSVTFGKPGAYGQFILNSAGCVKPRPALESLGVKCEWFNGIGFGGSKLYYPHKYYNLHYDQEYLDVLSQGEFVHDLTVKEDTDTGMDFSDNEISDVVIETWWDQLIRYGQYFVTGIIIVIAVWLGIKLTCCLIDNTKSSSSSVRIELGEFKSGKGKEDKESNDDGNKGKKAKMKKSKHRDKSEEDNAFDLF